MKNNAYKIPQDTLKEYIISLCALLNSSQDIPLIFQIALDKKISEMELNHIKNEILNNISPTIKKIEVFLEKKENNQYILSIKIMNVEFIYYAYQIPYIKLNNKNVVLESSRIDEFIKEKKDKRISKISLHVKRMTKSIC